MSKMTLKIEDFDHFFTQGVYLMDSRGQTVKDNAIIFLGIFLEIQGYKTL